MLVNNAQGKAGLPMMLRCLRHKPKLFIASSTSHSMHDCLLLLKLHDLISVSNRAITSLSARSDKHNTPFCMDKRMFVTGREMSGTVLSLPPVTVDEVVHHGMSV